MLSFHLKNWQKKIFLDILSMEHIVLVCILPLKKACYHKEEKQIGNDCIWDKFFKKPDD